MSLLYVRISGCQKELVKTCELARARRRFPEKRRLRDGFISLDSGAARRTI
jgi:hypothetical protein